MPSGQREGHPPTPPSKGGIHIFVQCGAATRHEKGPPFGKTHPCTPEGVKKLNDLGSPRPNEGEGLRGEGGGTCRIEPRGEAEEALQIRKDKRTLSQYGNPPHPPAPLPVGARGAAIELDFNFFTPSLRRRGISDIFMRRDSKNHEQLS